MKVNDHVVDMLVDTSCDLDYTRTDVVKLATCHIYLRDLRNSCHTYPRDLRSSSGDKLTLLGELTITVEYGTQKCVSNSEGD